MLYPSDLKAKVYKLDKSKYSKVADFTKEKLSFRDTGCDIELDFERVFKRFREV